MERRRRSEANMNVAIRPIASRSAISQRLDQQLERLGCDKLRLALAGEPIDFIFVDGPANWLGRRRDCRFGTLPLTRSLAAEEAVFVADDALRRRD
jgi:hypothetical protein